MRKGMATIGIAVLVVACSRAGAMSPSAEAIGTDSPAPSLTSQPSTPASLEPSPSDPSLRHAVELRRSLGLRSDLAWVEAVAADPRATIMWLDIPLLPEEEAELAAAEGSADAIAAVVNTYADSHRDEFGGVYIDRESNAGVVSLWTGHLAEHEAAILARLAPRARAPVRQVTYSEQYLRSLQDRVVADLDWMRSIPAVFQSAGVDIIRNVTLVSVSSDNPAAVGLIRAHYGFGAALEVESDGTGAALLPWGTVAGRVRTPSGGLPPPADYYLRWSGSGPGDCGGGDIGYGVSPEGTFTLPCQQGTWTIEVTVPGGDGWRTVGVGTVRVSAGRTSTLEIALAPQP